MNDRVESSQLQDRVTALVEAAKKTGADSADAVAIRSRSHSVSIRLGQIEATDLSESDDVSLRVFVGQRVASVSASAGSDPAVLAERALAMAKVSPEDPFQGLAEPEHLAQSIPDLDLFDDTRVASDRLIADALECEETARAVDGVTNSGGASASAGIGGMVLATSQGFTGQYRVSRFARSVSVIAGEGTAMERDYDFCSRLHFSDLDPPGMIGRKAGERAVRRLGARRAQTGPVTVVYDPRVARGMAGHLAASINGASVARKTSFLRERMGQPVMAKGVSASDDPTRLRGPGSRPFDGEGVSASRLEMVSDGVLKHWFLATSSARELGLVTNGRGSRSGSSVSPSSTNFAIEPGSQSPQSLIASLARGFYVTEVFGQGVDMLTGEYSRGASGFWIENGEVTYPVSEVTIASNLKDMFLNLTAANDLDRHFSTAAPTLVIEGMTLAGS